LAGSTWDETSVWLTSAGYNPIRVDEYSLEIEKDKVIRTEPPEGSVLNVGAEVKVFVSAGATLEMFAPVLVNNFATLDINGDGYVDWEEAKSKYPGISHEIFDQIDSNKDGKIEFNEAQVANEGEHEGNKEGEKTECSCRKGKDMAFPNTLLKYLLDLVIFSILTVMLSSTKLQSKK